MAAVVAHRPSLGAGQGNRLPWWQGCCTSPGVCSLGGHEVALPTWMAAQAEDWLGRSAMNLMLINYRRAAPS
jgi:hypothetical protein